MCIRDSVNIQQILRVFQINLQVVCTDFQHTVIAQYTYFIIPGIYIIVNPSQMSKPIITNIMRIPAIQRQITLYLLSTIGITLFGFISTMLFSHLLGKDLMGVYYLFLAYYEVFNMIGDGGFGQAAVKRISEGNDQNAYLTAYVALRALLIIVSTLILLLISPYFVDLQSYDFVLWPMYSALIPCLLYTSPSPRDLSTSRMPSSA
eukprot:TRINITY_DN26709_c0_g1_i1.p1 TRINITY_DN26709_c0_g1~~TRINITY_DN26709_c0_g1_i1.p1  ORF type:complete len:205 (+),score=8.07 TRINITY_DN26709_c0_g1_i1:166-780(+)